MRIQNIVHDACPICGKEVTLAVIEPHPTHSTITLHTYRCVDCGAVKTSSVLRSTAPRASTPLRALDRLDFQRHCSERQSGGSTACSRLSW